MKITKKLGLPIISKICLKTDDKISFDNTENADTFKKIMKA